MPASVTHLDLYILHKRGCTAMHPRHLQDRQYLLQFAHGSLLRLACCLTLVDTIATTSRVEGLAFSPDDQTLAWSDAVPAPLRLLDVASGRQSAGAAGSVPFAGEVLACSPAQSIAVGGRAG